MSAGERPCDATPVKKLALPFVVTTALSPALIDCNKEAAAPPPADAPKPDSERIHRNPPKTRHQPAEPASGDSKGDPAGASKPTSPGAK